MDGSAQLPPKPDVALALLQSAMSVYVHLDPRGPEVKVPAWFKKQPQLVLQVGMNMAVPIPDLDVGQTALSCTLSFNRRPEFCRIPWEAVYGLVGDDGRGMIWPDSIPPEVATARDAKARESQPARGHLRLAHSERAPAEGAAEDVVPPGVEPARSVRPAPEIRLSGNSNAVPRPDPTREGEAETSAAEDVVPPSDRPAQTPSVRPSAPPSDGSRPSKLPPYLRVVK